ncbi:MAG: Arc family DNA-binding protein [Deltaproteobacteria bacterium]|nr:Arc family DNA-binding protein [Deltaproteobacteria bacterium]
MPHALIRDIDPAALERLKERARNHGRSLQSELKDIIERAAERDLEGARSLAAKVRRKLAGRRHTDSAALIAADRRR